MARERTRSKVKVRRRPPKLIDVLRALPQEELTALNERVGIKIDGSKRIDEAEQSARALVMLPELRDPAQLPAPTRELLYRIAEAGGVLVVDGLPGAVEPLAARGIVFARGLKGGSVELILPIAHLLQVRRWEGEDPRSLRALLTQVTHEVGSSIASHYLGRTAPPPIVISLEPAWEELTNLPTLRKAVAALAPLERKLLEAVEQVGGEVDTEELLELEREPMRLRGATGATPSRRGIGFALERRGYLIPVHPNRHVIPSEVVRVVGARRSELREQRRAEVVSRALEEDHSPRRARFADDPAPLAIAMAMALRESSTEVKSDVGTPRSLITKFATRFGRDADAVALVASLSRAVGLWDPSVINITSPPGSNPVHEISGALFRAWQRGGAWDEARPDGEVLRASVDAREASAVGIVRETVVEALRELGEGRWVPWSAVTEYVRTDARMPGVTRLIERWATRAGVKPTEPAEIARRIALESLHVLGVVDIGDEGDDDEMGPTLRLTPRGRGFLRSSPPSPSNETSRFVDGSTLRVGARTRLGNVVALAPFVEVGRVVGHLDVVVSQGALSRAVAAGFDSDLIRARLSAVAQVPDPVGRMLAQASAVLGRGEFVETEGFLWVEDPEVRELLRTRRQTADLFVDPSPPSGLLIQPGVDIERLARRCRSLGVEVIVGGEVYRTHSTHPPSRSRSSGSMAAVDVGNRKSSGTRARARSRSSGSLRALKRG